MVENYHGATVEEIRACLAYTGSVLQSERVYPLRV